jgi:hypothetical protein
MIDTVSLGQVFLRELRFSPISIVPPMLETHSLVYHRHHTISAIDSAGKQLSLSYVPHSLDVSLRYRNFLTAN